jgi:Phasin protein
MSPSPRSREPHENCDLKVRFEDLNFEPAEETVQPSEQLLIFDPRQAYDAAVDCRVLLNREIIDIFQRNLNASFSLLRRLTTARSLAEIVELQAAHFNHQVAALTGQTQELATLSIRATLDMFRSSN